ncbi:hypothetical protein ACVXG8_27265 [Escherichia coli]
MGYDATAMQYNHDETKAKAEWDKVTNKPTSLTFLILIMIRTGSLLLWRHNPVSTSWASM